MPDNLTKEDFVKQVYPTFVKHGWVKTLPDGKTDNTSIFAMVQAEYGVSGMSELLVTQIPEILELAATPEVRDRWVK